MNLSAVRLRLAYRLFLAVITAIALFVIWSGWRLKYYGPLGPGPGFFPVWIGILLALACLAALFNSLAEGRDEAGTPFFEDAEGGKRVLLVIVALLALWPGLKYLGFRLAMLAFVWVVPRVFGARPLWQRAALALLLSFGVAYGFERGLGVELPAPDLEFLQALGF